jgi:adenylate kinase family enzyme
VQPLAWDTPLPTRPRRILVAGTSGAGKTTLAAALAVRLGLPHIDIDGLFHGPGWTPRPDFVADVAAFVAGDEWVTEWQYSAVRRLVLARADLLVWLDFSRLRVMSQIVARTVRRRLCRVELWNGNLEPPLWTIFTDRDHIVRWAWRTHPKTAARVRTVLASQDGPPVVRLRTRGEVAGWLAGPVTARATAR